MCTYISMIIIISIIIIIDGRMRRKSLMDQGCIPSHHSAPYATHVCHACMPRMYACTHVEGVEYLCANPTQACMHKPRNTHPWAPLYATGACVPVHMHAHTCMHANTCRHTPQGHACTHPSMHARLPACMHACTVIHKHMHTHMRICAHVNTRTH